MSISAEKLNELSEKLGILLSFTDYGSGKTFEADTKSKQTICASLGYPAHSDKAIHQSLARLENESYTQLTTPTHIACETELSPLVFEMALPKKFEHEQIAFSVIKEADPMDNGQFWFHDMPFIAEKEIEDVVYQKRRVYLFINAPLGYHQMHFILPDGTTHPMHLIVVPHRCYQPEKNEETAFFYGFPIQLYALRSLKNWGIGDLSDLKKLVNISKELGSSLIGVNPLSALFSDAPQDASPYSACARLFLNPIYADITEIEEFKTSKSLQKMVKESALQERLKAVRASKTVDYVAVTALKEEFFKLCHQAFMAANFNANGEPTTERGKAYETFCVEKGQALIEFATFLALREEFAAQNASLVWRNWEEGFQNPSSDRVRAFQKTHADTIHLIKYKQFIIFEQYESVLKHIQETGLHIGLYTDMPVGVCENSAEVWSNQYLFMQNVSTGAPPDAFNRKGQDWGLAPFHPLRLAQTGFNAFVQVVRRCMQGAGAVRIDHAFGLERLYLRVEKGSGAYLKYPFKALMGIVALESVRNKCLVIAEDLGTAPEGFAHKMWESQTYSFKILHFMRAGAWFEAPDCFPYYSLIASGTHDMASYSALWKGLDLELAHRLKTVTTAQYEAHKKDRKQLKETFINTFKRFGYPMPHTPIKINVFEKQVPDWFIENTYRYLNETNSRLLMVRLEDVFMQDEQVNMPGTCFEYPNWRYKLPVSLEDFLADKRLQKIAAILKDKRGIK